MNVVISQKKMRVSTHCLCTGNGNTCLYDGDDLLLAMLVTHMRIQALGILETNAALLAWENGTGKRVPMYQGLVR